MICQAGYIMQDFACKILPDTCDCTDCQLDANDNTCKRTMYEFDNPCLPSTFSAYESATSVISCNDCAPGKACEEFGSTAFSGTCEAGHYCVGKTSTRTPVKEYSSLSPNYSLINYF
jgi:hypothetical protein